MGLLGQVALIWFILAWLGNDLQLIVNLFSFGQQSYVAQSQPGTVPTLALILNLLLVIPAYILWGITILYTDIFPHWVGIISLVIALLTIIYLTSPSSSAVVVLIEIGNVFLAAAIARCGYLLLQYTFR